MGEQNGFIQILRRSAAQYPEKTAIACRGRHETYRELLEHVDRLSNALRRAGIGYGDRVGILSRNCPEYLESEFAAYQLGAVVVKLNWRMTATEVTGLLQENRVKLVVRGEGLMAAPEELARENPGIRFLTIPADPAEPSFRAFYEGEMPSFEPLLIPDTTPAMVVHTSGTTGKAKTVCFTHGDLLRKLELSLAVMPFASDTVFLLVEQMFHIACARAHMSIGIGCTLVLLPKFTPEEYLDTVQRERVTSSGMIPTVLKQILEHPRLEEYDISSLNTINYTTCAMPQPLIHAAIQKLHCGFYQVYGTTETLGIVTLLKPEEHFDEHIASVGRVIPGYEVKIEQTPGALCPPRQTGEILVRGAAVLRRYENDPEQSARVLTDGWYHTRDLGYLDEDGYLYVCGRKDDLIISGGENIYPQEIVDILLNVEDIMETAVYGVPDELWGERVWASVVLRPGSTLTERELMCYCRKNLANYKVPKGFTSCQSLPKNTTGKILVEQAAEQTRNMLKARLSKKT